MSKDNQALLAEMVKTVSAMGELADVLTAKHAAIQAAKAQEAISDLEFTTETVLKGDQKDTTIFTMLRKGWSLISEADHPTNSAMSDIKFARKKVR